MPFLLKIRAILGVLTDLLTAGRAQGWWTKKDSPADFVQKDDQK